MEWLDNKQYEWELSHKGLLSIWKKNEAIFARCAAINFMAVSPKLMQFKLKILHKLST